MTDYATDVEKRTANLTNRIFIGRDGTGAEHHYLTDKAAVVVVSPDGTRAHRQPLDEDNPIEQWVTFVGDKRGWQDQRLYQSFGEAVADTVEAGA